MIQNNCGTISGTLTESVDILQNYSFAASESWRWK
jgi:hypothetical protein